MGREVRLRVLEGAFAVCQLPPGAEIPPQVWDGGLVSVTRTPEEISIVCPAGVEIPQARCEGNWRALRVAGQLDFSLVGILARLTRFLANAGVSVFAISTFDTDYLLVRERDLRRALTALRRGGYRLEGDAPAPKDESAPRGPFVEVRRKELAVYDAAWMVDFLHKAAFGVLAFCGEGQPFTVARNFVYDAERHCIYLHGARQGLTFSLVGGGAPATFNVSRAGRLIAGKAAADMDTEYAGVVLFGPIAVVERPEEAEHGLRLLLGKYFPHLRYGADYTPITDHDLKRTAVLRLDIEAWSGKEKRIRR